MKQKIALAMITTGGLLIALTSLIAHAEVPAAKRVFGISVDDAHRLRPWARIFRYWTDYDKGLQGTTTVHLVEVDSTAGNGTFSHWIVAIQTKSLPSAGHPSVEKWTWADGDKCQGLEQLIAAPPALWSGDPDASYAAGLEDQWAVFESDDTQEGGPSMDRPLSFRIRYYARSPVFEWISRLDSVLSSSDCVRPVPPDLH